MREVNVISTTQDWQFTLTASLLTLMYLLAEDFLFGLSWSLNLRFLLIHVPVSLILFHSPIHELCQEIIYPSQCSGLRCLSLISANTCYVEKVCIPWTTGWTDWSQFTKCISLPAPIQLSVEFLRKWMSSQGHSTTLMKELWELPSVPPAEENHEGGCVFPELSSILSHWYFALKSSKSELHSS